MRPYSGVGNLHYRPEGMAIIREQGAGIGVSRDRQDVAVLGEKQIIQVATTMKGNSDLACFVHRP